MIYIVKVDYPNNILLYFICADGILRQITDQTFADVEHWLRNAYSHDIIIDTKTIN